MLDYTGYLCTVLAKGIIDSNEQVQLVTYKEFFCAWNANLFSSLLMVPLTCARDFAGFTRDFFFMFRSFVSTDFAENFTLLLMAVLFQIFAVLKKFASVDPFATVTRTWLEQKRLRGKLENNGARAKIKENLVQPTDAF